MMDKSWVHLNRVTAEYQEKVKEFIEIAKKNADDPELIRCPCKKCQNLHCRSGVIVYEHLIINGMDMTYTTWLWHGEQRSGAKCDVKMSETYKLCKAGHAEDVDILESVDEIREEDFMNFLEDAETPLYPSCTKYTRLSATVVLYKHKVVNGLSDKSFNELLSILHDMLPDDNTIPESQYSASKLLKSFDLEYKKIHACVNDCCLFRKDLEEAEACPKCGLSQWKVDSRTKKIHKRVPAKVLRYFPITPRFSRMFGSSEMAEHLRWHFTHKSTDGNMRHPVDSLAWDAINRKWPSFAMGPRNLRLGLAADGFNPFRNLSSKYSCWPVILVTYNMPPWLCMRKEQLMLTLLIPGPKQPGNDIDVYLQPLIEDLQELWNVGVDIYDAFTKSVFNLKAILMWTINDFPAYGNLAGCTTKGKTTCPVCGLNTCSQWLSFSRKTVYMKHRRFLSPNHPFRSKRSWFDGNHEYGEKPRIMNGSNIFNEVKNIKNDWGKGGKEKNKSNMQEIKMWKKKSIFFDLPYWEHLLLRHNLDVMHIEKNICESIIGTLLDLKGKSKDGLNSRKDLQEMGIRHELHPEDRGKRTYLPAAPHTLSKSEKQIFCRRLLDLKLPDGYSSNIGNCISIDDCKIMGLKSHDCHVLMQQLLSVALRGLLPKGPRNAIFRISAFFNELSQRVINREKLEGLEEEISETICMLERFFPPSFFDIMVHLAIHLGREARLCGPIQYRWMYPFERYMKTLKGYVRNRARPEGCIAECYLADECMRFCSTYMKQAGQMDERESRNQDWPEIETILEGRPISKGIFITLTDEMIRIAHRCVLFNTAEVEQYLEMHLEELKHSDRRLSRNKSLLWKRQAETFAEWLKQKIENHMCRSSVSKTLKWIAYGPRKNATSYSGYVINGKRFHKKESEKSTQNSGVSLEMTTMCRTSSKDTNQIVEKVTYYGVIKDIILLDYHVFQIPVFYCNWANIINGVKDEDGFTLVNLHEGQNQFDREPSILATQAKQVFYSRENDSSNWYVLLKAPPRGFHELDMFDEDVDTSSTPIDVSRLNITFDDEAENFVRSDCEGMYV